MRKVRAHSRRAGLLLLVAIVLAGLVSCAPTKEEEYERLLAESVDLLNERQEVLLKEFRLGEHDRWSWDQDSGELTLFDGEDAVVKAKIQFVGSFSTVSGSWLWAWANPTIRERMSVDSKAVRDLGRQKGYWKLTTAEWKANTVEGWNMTAIAARAANARGAYRTNEENGFSYLLIKDIEWIE